jgi:glucose/arabinose dehydrogenase
MTRPQRHPFRLAVATVASMLVALSAAGPAAGRTTGAAGEQPASPAAPAPGSIKLTLIADGLDQPVLITSARDGTGRLFIVEKTGRIKVLARGAVSSRPFLNLSTSVTRGPEQGLLGLAFHPRFATNRRYFVNFTDLAGDTVIREYRASATDPNRTEAGSGRTILRIDQPYSNHNGGMIAFGPDGYLYIGTGDGGGGGDPGNRAQSTASLLGKMLRIDVNGTTSTRNYRIPASNPYVGRTGRDEIWQRGLRNPWRWSFDRSTGNLWIGDVGQRRYEEVDRAVRTASGPGRAANWGWRVMEGFHCYNPSSGCNRTGKRLPLLEYSHSSDGRCAVTGGHVYRGRSVGALVGWYVYGDYCSGEIFAVAAGAASPASPVRLLDTSLLISSFGESAGRELFVVDLGGAVYEIDPV